MTLTITTCRKNKQVQKRTNRRVLLIGGHSGHYGKETGRGSCHTVTNQRQTDKRLAGHATVLMSTLRCQQSSKFIGQIIDSHYAEKQPNTRLQRHTNKCTMQFKGLLELPSFKFRFSFTNFRNCRSPTNNVKVLKKCQQLKIFYIEKIAQRDANTA